MEISPTPYCRMSYMTSTNGLSNKAKTHLYRMPNPYTMVGFHLAVGCVITTAGCNMSPNETPPAQSVYVDLRTKEVVVADATKHYPALHPTTGLATLMPAMYCESCAAWRQVPMPDQINHLSGPLVCIKCKRGLSIDGPLAQPSAGAPSK